MYNGHLFFLALVPRTTCTKLVQADNPCTSIYPQVRGGFSYNSYNSYISTLPFLIKKNIDRMHGDTVERVHIRDRHPLYDLYEQPLFSSYPQVRRGLSPRTTFFILYELFPLLYDLYEITCYPPQTLPFCGAVVMLPLLPPDPGKYPQGARLGMMITYN